MLLRLVFFTAFPIKFFGNVAAHTFKVDLSIPNGIYRHKRYARINKNRRSMRSIRNWLTKHINYFHSPSTRWGDK